MVDSTLLQRLLDVSREMAATRALDPLLAYALDVALEMFKAERGYIVLVHDDGMLDFRVNRDRLGHDIDMPEQEISYTILHDVVSTETPIITASAVDDPAFSASQSVSILKLRSVMCVPLVARAKVVGALYLESRAEEGLFTDVDLQTLSYFASQAAVSIENALLNNRLEAMVLERTERLREASAQLQHEVSERRGLDTIELQKALEQERMRVLTNFIQDASHQFRTPLAVINTTTDVLARKLEPGQFDTYLENIQRQVRTIVDLVETLVVMVKLESDVMTFESGVDLNAIARDMYAIKEHLAKRKHQHIVLETTATPQPIRGSSEYLRQAVGHILDNAIAFTPEQGKIVMRTIDGGDRVVLEVADSGAGIPDEHLSEIFARFFRSDTAGTTRGFGLGLSIVKKILELHDAEIDVDSEVNRGSVFRMIFSKET